MISNLTGILLIHCTRQDSSPSLEWDSRGTDYFLEKEVAPSFKAIWQNIAGDA